MRTGLLSTYLFVKHPLQQNKGGSSGHKTKQASIKQSKQAQLPCQSASLDSLSALTACLFYLVLAIGTWFSVFFFAVATNTNSKIGSRHHESVCINEMSMSQSKVCQGSLTEGEGLVQSTSLYQLVKITSFLN
jgi:hypothetical protein